MTKLIQYTELQKVTKKVIQAIYRPVKKKLKRSANAKIEISINGNNKSPQIYTLSQFLTISENNYGIY